MTINGCRHYNGEMGTHSIYTEDLADKICDLVIEGSNLNKIVALDGMPARGTIYKWFDEHKEFKDKYTRAREARADWRFDKLDEITQDMRKGIIDPSQARVEMDIIKWQAGKENSKNYGDKVTSVVTDPDGNALPAQTILITETAIKDMVQKIRNEF